MPRKTDVREHEMHLSDGRVVIRHKHKRTIPFSDNFNVLSEKWAQKFNEKRLSTTHPDAVKTSRVVFIKPVKIWAKHPEKYDVFRLDSDNVPKYDTIPKAGWPHQIVKVKGKFYVANENGVFKRYFPPKQADKLSRYLNKLDLVEDKHTGELIPKGIDQYSGNELRQIAKEKGIKKYWTYDKKQLGKKIIENFEKEQNLT